MTDVRLLHGDCLALLRELPDASVDACVTDPPYGLSFMGKGWDHAVPSTDVWREVLRVLKPGAHLLAFFGTRTYHRGVVAIEDAGFEIRDQIGWAFGSGFPKSHDVSKAIDAAAGAVREVVGRHPNPGSTGERRAMGDGWQAEPMIIAPATPEAQRWQGWGTALKPAWEPIVVARKPLEGTVAANVLAWGTGAINVDGCRVEGEPWSHPGSNAIGGVYGDFSSDAPRVNTSGRWPANLIHDGSDEVVGLFPVTGPARANPRNNGNFKSPSKGREYAHVTYGHDDAGGSAARFFYCAKASRADRDDGVNGGELRANHHPTVKPTDLMRYLVRLVTPPGGVVLDPFMGSGSTGRGAVLEGFDFIGCELDADYLAIARARIATACPKPQLPPGQLTLF